MTGYPSIDRIHYKGTSWSERHPLIPSISVPAAIDFSNMFRQDAYAFDCQDLRVTHRQFRKNTVMRDSVNGHISIWITLTD